VRERLHVPYSITVMATFALLSLPLVIWYGGSHPVAVLVACALVQVVVVGGVLLRGEWLEEGEADTVVVPHFLLLMAYLVFPGVVAAIEAYHRRAGG
jgi:hypothetical protein